MTYDRASKKSLHLQPRLISSLSGPLGDQTAVAPTAWSGVRGLRWRRKILAACFWWNSSWDLSSYASLPEWHYTFLAPNLFACSLISYMRGKTDWHLFPLPPSHWSRSRKKKKKAERNRGHRQLEAIWLCYNHTSECKPQPQQLHVFHE